jgi:hypothetical protein
MTKILWDQIGERTYEVGVDQGVLYLPNRSGIPWNGLISIEEQTSDTKVTSHYIDGVRYFNERSIGDFSAVINAFTYPEEFLPFDGYAVKSQGVILDEQPVADWFFLSYRTFVGNDVLGTDYGYKIHLLYNLTATPSSRKHNTLGNDVDISDFSWEVIGVPETVSGYRPTCHVIFDMRLLDQLAVTALEDKLYGTDSTEATIPTLEEIVELVYDNNFEIVDHGDGTWTASGPAAFIEYIDARTFEITRDDAVQVDADTFTITDGEAT